MTDHPRFHKPTNDFEQTYREHHGWRLVDLVLRLADQSAVIRGRVLQTAGLLLVLLCLLGAFVYASANRDAARAHHVTSPPVPWARALDAPAYADQPSVLPGKFAGYQGLFLP